jgi:hypothetical protein
VQAGVQALETPAQPVGCPMQIEAATEERLQWCAVWYWPFHVKPYVKPFTDRATAERYVARQARINPARRWVVERRKEIA